MIFPAIYPDNCGLPDRESKIPAIENLIAFMRRQFLHIPGKYTTLQCCPLALDINLSVCWISNGIQLLQVFLPDLPDWIVQNC